jgi:hypothetical protein
MGIAARDITQRVPRVRSASWARRSILSTLCYLDLLSRHAYQFDYDAATDRILPLPSGLICNAWENIYCMVVGRGCASGWVSAPFLLAPSNGVFGHFDLAALRGCHICLFDIKP